MIKPEPKDLSGDPVYEYLKKNVLPDFDLLGGYITNRNSVGPKEPRKLITIELKHKKTGKRVEYSYNYNKLDREL